MDLNELNNYCMMHRLYVFWTISRFFIEREHRELKMLPSTGEVINFFANSVGQEGWARSDHAYYSELEEQAYLLLEEYSTENEVKEDDSGEQE